MFFCNISFVHSMSQNPRHLAGECCVNDTAGMMCETDILAAILAAEQNLPLLPAGCAVQPD